MPRGLLAFIGLLLCSPPALAGGGGHGLGEALAWWSVLPFAGMLLSIAVLPMVVTHWWHSNRNQLLVALGWAAPVLVWLGWLIVTDHDGLGHLAGESLYEALLEYSGFIALLGSLYVISGGILLRGDLRATPAVNVSFLAVGAVLSNFIGTTGASMLLIRPMLRTNAEREHTWHIPLFFIFIVSNVGGSLTPIGDPPLFLGYLRGVPFFWTLVNLWYIWLPTVIVLLGMFYVLDTFQYRKEDERHRQLDAAALEPLRLEGRRNFWLLGGVIACVLLLSPPQANPDDFRHYHVRELAMIGLTAASVWITPRALRIANDFSWVPILEVAALFVGIFITMIPALALLNLHGGALGVTEPWQYFWATGALSSFLDNAPTYLTFAAMACGIDPECADARHLTPLSVGEYAHILQAISLGAVFCGAMTYIGNGPNFMVRSIAEQSGYKMPSFFGYMGYASMFLLPVFVMVTLIWLV